MKSILTLIFLVSIYSGNSLTQTFSSNNIYNSYSKYKATQIQNKIFKHSELKKLVEEIKKRKNFKVEIAGKSLEGREIYLLSIGTGKTNVLLWSQMHGDESTASMALFDLFNFFEADDEFNDLRKQILKNVKIYFIPMLNPDGAEEFKRRNGLNIDLNRDALRLEFPESKILKSVRDSLKPKFAFNLHDQNTRYTSGNSYHSATLSFLAPAYNYEKEINEVRGNAMKVIVNLYDELSKFIPGHIAKYKDDFEPRAFGDNFVKWGTSSILIESGGWKNDEEKQFIRKLNFLSILIGLNSITNKLYAKANIDTYNNIPFNDNLLFDVLLRNLSIKYNSKFYKIDVGINRDEKLTSDLSQKYYIGKIDDWGDLSIFFGYSEMDLNGYEIKPSKIYEAEIAKLNELNFNKLLKEGVGFIRIDSISLQRDYSGIPFNLVLKNAKVNIEPKYEGFANFTIWQKGKLKFNIINGFIYDLTDDIYDQNNGLIFN